MGRYANKFKRLVLPLNVVKEIVTVSMPGNRGQVTTAGPGNEGIEMVEWINDRIEDGSIIFDSTGSGETNLTFSRNSTTVTVISDTGTDAILPASTSLLAGIMTATDKVNLTSLITLSGLVAGSNHLGTFTGSIIPDSVTIKQALQSLESAIVTTPLPVGVDGDIMLYYTGAWHAASPVVDNKTNVSGLTFNLSLPVRPGLFMLFKNGQYMNDPDDYTRAATVITMATGLTITDKMTAIYYS